jgi:hypothetical protein
MTRKSPSSLEDLWDLEDRHSALAGSAIGVVRPATRRGDHTVFFPVDSVIRAVVRSTRRHSSASDETLLQNACKEIIKTLKEGYLTGIKYYASQPIDLSTKDEILTLEVMERLKRELAASTTRSTAKEIIRVREGGSLSLASQKKFLSEALASLAELKTKKR